MFALLMTLLLAPHGSLYGTVVVIDPGHGGQDPGSHGQFGGKPVYESVYNYDVALRVRDEVRKRGGVPFLTVEDRDWSSPNESEPAALFPMHRDVRFKMDGTEVRARTIGLLRRLAYANTIRRRYPRHRVVFIAIHFDVVGKRADVAGVQIIASRSDCPLGRSLLKSFSERMRKEHPVEVSGQGARRLFILNGHNSIKERVLVELGNFNNPGDLWRIRNPEIRQDYAKRIAQALAR